MAGSMVLGRMGKAARKTAKCPGACAKWSMYSIRGMRLACVDWGGDRVEEIVELGLALAAATAPHEKHDFPLMIHTPVASIHETCKRAKTCGTRRTKL